MPRLPMTEVLISRTMTRTRPDGVQSQCSINFGTPTIDPNLTTADMTMYYCPIQFVGFQDDMIYAIGGEDPLEALIKALCFAGTSLGVMLYANQLDEWDASFNYGFPVLPTVTLPSDPPPGGPSPNQ